MAKDTKPGGRDGTTPDELEKLRRENAELKARVPEGKPGRARSFFSWLLIVLMCVATLGAALTVWVHYTTLNTTRFVNVVAGLVKEPDVDKALSQEAINRLFAKYDLAKRIETQLKNKLPDLLKSGAEPLTSGAEGLAKGLASDVLKSQAFQSIWRNILATTHSEAVKGIRANGTVSINDQGEVVLDISRLLTGLKDRLASVGLGFLKGVDIPIDLGRVVLYKNAQLGNVRTAVRTLDTLFWVLPWVAAFLLIGAVLLADNRRRALVGSAIGVILVMIILLGAVKGVEAHYVSQINDLTNRTAAMVVAGHVEGGIYLVEFGLVLLSLLTLLSAIVAGPYGWSVGLHLRISRSGRKAKRLGAPLERNFLDAHAWILRLLGLAAAMLLILYLPWANVAVVVVVCVAFAAWLVALEFLR
jgi:hypothetical protein